MKKGHTTKKKKVINKDSRKAINEKETEIDSIQETNVTSASAGKTNGCLVCGKTFKSTNYLLLQNKIHQNIKDLKCPECPAKFSRK